MATNTVGDFVVERMHQWGVRRIYGYPGYGINAAPRWQRFCRCWSPRARRGGANP